MWSLNRVEDEKHFSWKNHTQNVVEKLLSDPFFLKSQN